MLGAHEPRLGFRRFPLRRSFAMLGATLVVAAGTSFISPPASAVGVWSVTSRMTTERSHHVAIVLGDSACSTASSSVCGKVLVAGGQGQSGSLDSVEVFDPSNETWSAGPSMIEARTRHGGVLLHGPACGSSEPPTYCGHVLVVGGVGANGEPLASSEILDPVSGHWASAGALAAPRADHTATLLPDGRVLVVGGAGDAPPEIYDPVQRSWSSAGAMGLSRSFGHTATLLGNGSVLVAGGVVAGGSFTDAAELYDSVSNAWSPTAPLAVARADHTATSLRDGRVIVAGGRDVIAPRRSTEIYDPASSGWSGVAAMSVARSDHTATLLPDGRVLTAGGGRPDAAAAEIFDPGELRWSATGSLQRGRIAHTASPLQQACGQACGVLVAGGLSNGSLRSSELFDASASTPPGRVTDLGARAISPSKIELTFSAPGINDGGAPAVGDYVVKQARRRIGNLSDFERARSLCGGVCAFSPERVGDRITLTVSGLDPETKHFYAIRSVGEGGELGAISNRVGATTPSGSPPGEIVNPRAAALAPRKIRLIFSAPGVDGMRSPAAERYVIKQARGPIDTALRYRRARPLCGGVCRFSTGEVGERLRLRIVDLRPGTTYHYAIRAKDNEGNLGPRSASVKATTPEK